MSSSGADGTDEEGKPDFLNSKMRELLEKKNRMAPPIVPNKGPENMSKSRLPQDLSGAARELNAAAQESYVPTLVDPLPESSKMDPTTLRGMFWDSPEAHTFSPAVGFDPAGLVDWRTEVISIMTKNVSGPIVVDGQITREALDFISKDISGPDSIILKHISGGRYTVNQYGRILYPELVKKYDKSGTKSVDDLLKSNDYISNVVQRMMFLDHLIIDAPFESLLMYVERKAGGESGMVEKVPSNFPAMDPREVSALHFCLKNLVKEEEALELREMAAGQLPGQLAVLRHMLLTFKTTNDKTSAYDLRKAKTKDGEPQGIEDADLDIGVEGGNLHERIVSALGSEAFMKRLWTEFKFPAALIKELGVDMNAATKLCEQILMSPCNMTVLAHAKLVSSLIKFAERKIRSSVCSDSISRMAQLINHYLCQTTVSLARGDTMKLLSAVSLITSAGYNFAWKYTVPTQEEWLKLEACVEKLKKSIGSGSRTMDVFVMLFAAYCLRRRLGKEKERLKMGIPQQGEQSEEARIAEKVKTLHSFALGILKTTKDSTPNDESMLKRIEDALLEFSDGMDLDMFSVLCTIESPGFRSTMSTDDAIATVSSILSELKIDDVVLDGSKRLLSEELSDIIRGAVTLPAISCLAKEGPVSDIFSYVTSPDTDFETKCREMNLSPDKVRKEILSHAARSQIDQELLNKLASDQCTSAVRHMQEKLSRVEKMRNSGAPPDIAGIFTKLMLAAIPQGEVPLLEPFNGIQKLLDFISTLGALGQMVKVGVNQMRSDTCCVITSSDKFRASSRPTFIVPPHMVIQSMVIAASMANTQGVPIFFQCEGGLYRTFMDAMHDHRFSYDQYPIMGKPVRITPDELMIVGKTNGVPGISLDLLLAKIIGAVLPTFAGCSYASVASTLVAMDEIARGAISKTLSEVTIAISSHGVFRIGDTVIGSLGGLHVGKHVELMVFVRGGVVPQRMIDAKPLRYFGTPINTSAARLMSGLGRVAVTGDTFGLYVHIAGSAPNSGIIHIVRETVDFGIETRLHVTLPNRTMPEFGNLSTETMVHTDIVNENSMEIKIAGLKIWTNSAMEKMKSLPRVHAIPTGKVEPKGISAVTVFGEEYLPEKPGQEISYARKALNNVKTFLARLYSVKELVSLFGVRPVTARLLHSVLVSLYGPPEENTASSFRAGSVNPPFSIFLCCQLTFHGDSSVSKTQPAISVKNALRPYSIDGLCFSLMCLTGMFASVKSSGGSLAIVLSIFPSISVSGIAPGSAARRPLNLSDLEKIPVGVYKKVGDALKANLRENKVLVKATRKKTSRNAAEQMVHGYKQEGLDTDFESSVESDEVLYRISDLPRFATDAVIKKASDAAEVIKQVEELLATQYGVPQDTARARISVVFRLLTSNPTFRNIKTKEVKEELEGLDALTRQAFSFLVENRTYGNETIQLPEDDYDEILRRISEEKSERYEKEVNRVLTLEEFSNAELRDKLDATSGIQILFPMTVLYTSSILRPSSAAPVTASEAPRVEGEWSNRERMDLLFETLLSRNKIHAMTIRTSMPRALQAIEAIRSNRISARMRDAAPGPQGRKELNAQVKAELEAQANTFIASMNHTLLGSSFLFIPKMSMEETGFSTTYICYDMEAVEALVKAVIDPEKINEESREEAHTALEEITGLDGLVSYKAQLTPAKHFELVKSFLSMSYVDKEALTEFLKSEDPRIIELANLWTDNGCID